MPILDLQKRSRELGRIRLGQKGDRGQPQKLDRFRFTTNSQALLAKIADLYGGDVRTWEGGTQAWELISDTTRVPIMVPPQPVSQWFEYWTRAGCLHRCDGYTNVLTDEACDPEDPKHIEALAKPTTRLNVVLRDVEGIGVWRVETHGWNAAVELPDVAEFLAQAGGYVNGWLSLEQRTSVDSKQSPPVTRHYMVPIIEIDVTPAQLMAGQGRVAAPALSGGPVGATPALAAAGPDYVALAADLTTRDEVAALWHTANEAGHMTQGLQDYLTQRAHEVTMTVADPPAPEVPSNDAMETYHAHQADRGDPVVEAEVVDDPNPDLVWSQIMAIAAAHGLPVLADLETDVATFLGGTTSAEASGAELAAYLQDLTTHPRKEAVS